MNRIRAAAGLVGLVGLACRPELTGSAQPGPGWPDLAAPTAGSRDAEADAALIVALEQPGLGGRPGAWAVASAWFRYFVDGRGLRPGRVILLRDEQATRERIERALAQIEGRVGTGGRLWMIYIGAGRSPSDGGAGRLQTANGEFDQTEVLARLAYGLHESAFVLFDACADPQLLDPSWSSGLAAIAPPLPPGQFTPMPPELELGLDSPSYASTGAALPVEAGNASLLAGGSRRRNLYQLTAGLGLSCAAHLAGREWPALAWAALAGLQGWADADADAMIRATELTSYAQALLAREPGVAVAAAGVDLELARLTGAGPASSIPPAPVRVDADELADADATLILALEDMLPVPAGSFVMGCREGDRDCEDDERPAHEVTLHAYAIDRHEVRWADYRSCVERGLCPKVSLWECEVWTGSEFVRGGELPAEMFADDHPVFCVDWREAVNFCQAAGKRLPTEAEWERAARGLDGRRFPWGRQTPTCARATIDGCSEHFTRAVGSGPAGISPVGAHDMAGNVAEWVFDWWDPRGYRRQAPIDPQGPSHGEVRVVRGGSFYNADVDLRAGYRYGLTPESRMSIVGFRCAR